MRKLKFLIFLAPISLCLIAFGLAFKKEFIANLKLSSSFSVYPKPFLSFSKNSLGPLIQSLEIIANHCAPPNTNS